MRRSKQKNELGMALIRENEPGMALIRENEPGVALIRENGFAERRGRGPVDIVEVR